MTTKENPAPRVNVEGRGHPKIEQGEYKGSEDGWKPPGARGPGGGLGLRNSVRKSGRIDFDRINAEALVCLDAICRRLLPNGRREGNEYLALNPRRGDRHLGSFRINLANGRWADFALADKSARGGDPISLVAYLLNIRQSEAARGLMRMLGMDARQ